MASKRVRSRWRVSRPPLTAPLPEKTAAIPEPWHRPPTGQRNISHGGLNRRVVAEVYISRAECTRTQPARPRLQPQVAQELRLVGLEDHVAGVGHRCVRD